MNRKLVLGVLMGVAVSGYAFAGEGIKSSSNPDKTFSSLDTDKSGTLTKEEATKHSGIAHNFSAVDLDQDGTLDSSEFLAAIQKINVANQE